MKQFILYASKAVTTPDFLLNDLPGSGGRMDLVARCICNALWISHDLRRDSCIHVVACGDPSPPIVLSFYGGRLRDVSPDERNIASWIKKALALKRKNPGIRIRKLSFRELAQQLASEGNSFYLLHEHGRDIARVTIRENPVFILGDHIGLPVEEERFLEHYEHEKLSLGPVSYLASQCISVVHYELDKKISVVDC
jgi:tRNA (pseudouridine54-N1)-methyltransferase